MKKKQALATVLAVSMVGSMLAACGSTQSSDTQKSEAAASAETTAAASEASTEAESTASAETTEAASAAPSDYKGTIRWLNFKPEVADQMQDVAKAYTDETGIKVQIDTAASNTYQQTLTARMDSDEAPSIFVLTGATELAEWKDYCRDLSDTQLNSWLTDSKYSLKDDNGVYGISYALEGWGIIVNKGITDKYFASPNTSTDYTSLDDLYTFDALNARICSP